MTTAVNILVTGASRGIGRAIVLRFAREGAGVAFCSRSIDKLEELAREVRAVNPEARMYYAAHDLSLPDQSRIFAKNAATRLGTIDILVNNAGVFLPGDILSAEDGELERMMNLNLFSAYHASRELIPGMLQRKKGHIFNICSVASLKAYPNGSLYSITKFALLGLSKSLRAELQDRSIRVTSVLPGATWTDSWEGIELPESRFMKAEDIADAIRDVWELSDRTVVEEIVLRPQKGDI